MLVSLRPDRTGSILAAGVAGLALVAIYTGPPVRQAAVVLISIGALFGWLRAIHHSRLILDTPTSRIASAAQGYVELFGEGRPLSGTPLLSPMNALPVLWYRLKIDQKSGDKWITQSDIESDGSFLLDDGSGQCAVDPEGAEMLVSRKDVERRDDMRYTQWCLLQRDPIYAIGDFTTLGSIELGHDTAAQVRELLAEWKTNRTGLLERFDVDGDGEIDLREWELARAEARREIHREQAELRSAAEAHVLRKPPDRRLYLISDLDPQQLGKRYQLWGWLFLTMMLAGAGALFWLSTR